MKKVYVSPVLEQEMFETADVITASGMFINGGFNYGADEGMTEVVVEGNYFD